MDTPTAFLYLLPKISFEATLFFAAAFLGVHLGENWKKPIDKITKTLIIIVIVSIVGKAWFEYLLSQ